MSAEDKTGLTTIAALAAVILAGFALKAIAATALGFAAGLVVAGQSRWLGGLLERAWAGLGERLCQVADNFGAKSAPVTTSAIGAGQPLADRSGYLGFASLEARARPWFTGAKNIAKFFAGCIAFAVRHPIPCLGIVLLALFFIAGPPSCIRLPFGESREHAIARANQNAAEVRTQKIVVQRNDTLHEIARDVAVDREQIRAISARGQDEIERATPENETPIDPVLVASWRNAISQLCQYPSPDGSFPDSCG